MRSPSFSRLAMEIFWGWGGCKRVHGRGLRERLDVQRSGEESRPRCRDMRKRLCSAAQSQSHCMPCWQRGKRANRQWVSCVEGPCSMDGRCNVRSFVSVIGFAMRRLALARITPRQATGGIGTQCATRNNRKFFLHHTPEITATPTRLPGSTVDVSLRGVWTNLRILGGCVVGGLEERSPLDGQERERAEAFRSERFSFFLKHGDLLRFCASEWHLAVPQGCCPGGLRFGKSSRTVLKYQAELAGPGAQRLP